MTVVIHDDVEQNSPEWRRLRVGMPTASEFSAVLAKGKGLTRRAYLYRLAGEVIRGEPEETYHNADMARGHEQEAEARALYALMHDVEPREVGFISNGRAGCSPDALIGEEGLLEIKSAKPSVLIGVLDQRRIPAEHTAQVQGQMWVSGRRWVDLMVYCPGLPPFIGRAIRDEDYIANLAAEVEAFCFERDAVVKKVRGARQ